MPSQTPMNCSCDEYDDERSSAPLLPSRKKRRIMLKMADDDNLVAKKEPQPPPPVLDVFTAVVLNVNDSNNNNNINKSKQQTRDESYFMAPAQSLYLFKTFSLLLGLLIGVFIQFSSLGANYLVEQIGWQHQLPPTEKDDLAPPFSSSTWWGWALVWSMATSTVGVLVLLTLRSLLQEIGVPSHRNSNNQNQQQEQVLLLLIMECYFAVGALAGVCLAWMGTDLVLQSSRHLIHSAVTLVMALAWCKLLSSCCFPVLAASAMHTSLYPMTHNDDDDDSPAEDVEFLGEALNDIENARDCTTLSKPQPNRCWVKCTSLFLGALIGIFIQYSSLGANFLIQHLEHTEAVLEAQMKFSLCWSVFTSGMGIAILFLIRGLLVLLSGHHDHINGKTTLNNNQYDCNNILMTVECYFATGAVLGLNLAWTATDVMLGLGSHVTSSVLTLVGTLVWCKLVLYCCGYGRSADDEVREDDEVGGCP